MALLLLHQGELGTIRRGDLLFSYEPRAEFPLHVGISDAEFTRAAAQPVPELPAYGIPGQLHGVDHVARAIWGRPREWRPDIAGQHLQAPPTALNDVVLLAQATEREHSMLPEEERGWNEKAEIDTNRFIADGVPLFVRGTCSQFVEFIYETVRLDLVDQQNTRDPDNPDRLYPATQVHACWTGSFPLSGPWDDRLRSYPECLFGDRSATR